jgi:hypothetical protein
MRKSTIASLIALAFAFLAAVTFALATAAPSQASENERYGRSDLRTSDCRGDNKHCKYVSRHTSRFWQWNRYRDHDAREHRERDHDRNNHDGRRYRRD